MDTGFWIRLFEYNIYGQKVYLGSMSWIITTPYSQVIHWNCFLTLWTTITLGDEAIYYMK